MNATEEKACAWLAASKGVGRDDIVYSATSTPDFILPDESMYEVKLLYKDKMILFPSQITALSHLPKVQVLVFKRDGAKPLAIIPAGELIEAIEKGRDSCHNIKLVIYASTLRVYLHKEVWDALRKYTYDRVSSQQPLGRLSSTSIVAEVAIKEFLERKGYLSV